jgi:uncharacterized repeat protein (TIGR01451 family)
MVAPVVAALPADGRLLLASSRTGVYFGDSDAFGWTPVGTGPALLDSALSGLAVAGGGSEVAYATVGYPSVAELPFYRTTDGGDQWQARTPPFPPSCVVADLLAVDPSDANTVYAAPGQPCDVSDRLFRRSNDGGASWQDLAAPSTGYIARLAIDARSGTLWAVTRPRSSYQQGLSRSDNTGSSWSAVVLPGCTTSCSVTDVLSDQVHGALYVSLANGDQSTLLRSGDDGASWTPVVIGAGANGALAVGADGATIVSMESGGAFAVSTDGGATWRTGSVTPAIPAGGGIRSVAIDPSDPSTIVISGNGYSDQLGGGFTIVDASHDAGLTWASASTGLPDDHYLAPYQVFAFDARDPRHQVATLGAAGAAVTTDGGASWRLAGGLVDAATTRSALSVLVDPRVPGRVVLGTFDGVWVSNDGGATYAQTTLDHGLVDALALDPASGALLAGAYDGGLWSSSDGGATWQALAAAPGDASINAIVFASPSVALAATSSTGVWRSVDGGASWMPTSLTAGWVNALALDPTDPGTIYAGSCQNPFAAVVEKSTDSGLTWQPAAGGLSAHCLNALAVDGSDPDLVYAASGGAGVFASDDGGSSWSPLDDGLGNGVIYALGLTGSGQSMRAGGQGGLFDYTFSADLFSELTLSQATVTAGGPQQYDVIFGNDGPDDASNVTATLTLPAGVSAPVPSGSGASCTGGTVLVCHLRTLAAGDGIEITFTAAAPQTAGRADATATITGDRSDPVGADNASAASFDVSPAIAPPQQAPDTTPPAEVRLAGAPGRLDPLARHFSMTRTLLIGLEAFDDSPGPLRFDLRARTATPQRPLGPYRLMRSGITSPTTTVTLPAGGTACFDLRATDASGNASSWTGDRCTAVPLPAAALHRNGPWRRQHIAGTSLGDAEQTSSPGATLSLGGVVARRLSVVATKCPHCGRLAVSLAGHVVATLNLAASRTQAAALLQLAPFSAQRRGALTLTATSRGRRVRVIAVGVSAA